MINALKLSAAVGTGQLNRPDDVRTIQDLLCRNPLAKSKGLKIKVDGIFGTATEKAILLVQISLFKHSKPDGIVSSGQLTIRQLSLAATDDLNCDPKISIGGIRNSIFVDMAKVLGCETAAIKAVVDTEVGIRGAFDSSRRATILFERHVFSKLTSGKFDKSNPDISNPVPGGYGRFSDQYSRLSRAQKLDNDAALKSASWGAFQIMGSNHAQAGFSTVNQFVTAMNKSIEEQAKAFVNFINSDNRLVTALDHKNWVDFARIYNGPGYKVNNYDNKMKLNYNRILFLK